MREAKSFQERRSGNTFGRLPIKMRPVFYKQEEAGETLIFRGPRKRVLPDHLFMMKLRHSFFIGFIFVFRE